MRIIEPVARLLVRCSFESGSSTTCDFDLWKLSSSVSPASRVGFGVHAVSNDSTLHYLLIVYFPAASNSALSSCRTSRLLRAADTRQDGFGVVFLTNELPGGTYPARLYLVLALKQHTQNRRIRLLLRFLLCRCHVRTYNTRERARPTREFSWK